MREDSIAKKLYILDLNSSAIEQILYDFSLNAGDTLNAQYQLTAGSIIIVDSVGSTSLSNGEIRNIFYLNSGTFYIESIGGRNGLMSPLISFSGGSGETLGCVKLNGVVHYDGGICYVPVGINTNSNDPHLTVYYEKEYQNIKINSKNLELKGEFKILNLEGKIIFSKIIEEDNLSINANNLNSGIYLYQYEMLNGKIITGKISLTK
ncbi:MAG: T9SS type A sorting domain-containing protein [Bacteroidetes bacterium]|nr:T9SS type A sorting domain-containing protein [Bacteroidota bacterium]